MPQWFGKETDWNDVRRLGTAVNVARIVGAGHDPVSLDANAATVLTVGAGDAPQELGLQEQAANTVWAGPAAGANAVPTFRALVTADLDTVLPYAIPNLTLSTVNAEGAADTVIRSDATILIFDVNNPTTIQCDDAAAVGTAHCAARRDHKHAIVCAAPGANLSVSTTNQEGTATSFARSDHSHAITSSTNPGSAAAILASAADGGLQLVRLGIGTDPDTDNAVKVADNAWVGLGAAKGRIQFDDQATDEVNFLGCNVGIGTSTPSELLHAYGNANTDTTGLVENPNAGNAARAVVAAKAEACQASLVAISTGYASAHRQDRASVQAEATAAGLDVCAIAAAGDIKYYVGGILAADLNAQMGGGDWTTSSWARALELKQAGMLKWVLGTSWAWGIGQTGDNLYVARSSADDNSAAANYAMFFSGSTGRVGINSTTVSAQCHVDQSVDDEAIPVLLLDQADVDEEFISFTGEAAEGDLTRSIVDEGDQGSATLKGWLKVYVTDVGDQIADQAYHFPIYTLAA